MNKILILLFGAIALILLAWLCLGRHAPAIEQDLVTRTDDALKTAGIDWSSVGIDGRDVILTGKAPAADLRDRAEEIARGVYGVRTVDNRITVNNSSAAAPSPIALSVPYEINFSKNSGGVVISGMVPDEETRVSVVEIARQHVGADKVQDRLLIVSGAPAGWRSAAEGIAAELDQFLRMNAALVDNELRLAGIVDSADVRMDIEQAISGSLSSGGYKPKYEIMVPVPLAAASGCQQQFDRLLAERKIHFETASAQITPESYPLLDELARVASECPNAKIEIEGHTDARGSEQMNMKLSQARAESVVDYLVHKGISENRLSAVGYGESRPVADNETEAGRIKNRRIEFNVNIQGS